MNTNQAVVIQEAAVSTTSLTPEQLAEAAKFFASQQQEVVEAAAEASQIDQQKKAELIATFNELINNPKYWENSNRIQRLEDALKLPKFSDRSMQQFYISAEDELLKNAAKRSANTGDTAIIPTEDEILALAKKKKAEKDAKDAKKAAKKNS